VAGENEAVQDNYADRNVFHPGNIGNSGET